MVFCLLTAFGFDCCAFDETGAAGDGARVVRLKSAATAAIMKARFIGILLRMTIVIKGDHRIHAVKSHGQSAHAASAV